MPSDDGANSVIPQTRFRVHGNTFFLSRKRASGKGYMESRPYSVNGLLQHITHITQKGGHTLDCVITRDGSDLLADLEVLPRCLSDHNGILCELHMTLPVDALQESSE